MLNLFRAAVKLYNKITIHLLSENRYFYRNKPAVKGLEMSTLINIKKDSSWHCRASVKLTKSTSPWEIQQLYLNMSVLF